jgi:hypothetical protein
MMPTAFVRATAVGAWDVRFGGDPVEVRMTKIFGIGLSKTGTTSLCHALRILGYSTVDFPRTIAAIRKHDAATDTSVSVQFERLDRLYPGSKFIYTIRDLEAWLRSCERYWELNLRTIERQATVIEVFTKLYGSNLFERRRFAEAYVRHERRVLDYFADRPHDLQILDICGNPDWSDLCAFLDDPHPEVGFPRSNTFRQAVCRARRQRIWKAVRPVVPKFIRPLVKPS